MRCSVIWRARCGHFAATLHRGPPCLSTYTHFQLPRLFSCSLHRHLRTCRTWGSGRILLKCHQRLESSACFGRSVAPGRGEGRGGGGRCHENQSRRVTERPLLLANHGDGEGGGDAERWIRAGEATLGSGYEDSEGARRLSHNFGRRRRSSKKDGFQPAPEDHHQIREGHRLSTLVCVALRCVNNRRFGRFWVWPVWQIDFWTLLGHWGGGGGIVGGGGWPYGSCLALAANWVLWL